MSDDPDEPRSDLPGVLITAAMVVALVLIVVAVAAVVIWGRG